VRLFDDDGQPLTDWQPWRLTLPLTAGSGDLLVVYRTASQQAFDVVHLDIEVALLPDVQSEQVLAVTPFATASPTPPMSPLPTATPRRTSQPTATRLAVTATATVTGTDKPDVLVIYDARSLALINVSGRALDLTALKIVGADETLPANRWQTPWLSGSLAVFASGDCLQAWAWTETGDLPLPAGCRYRRGVINVAPEARFWAEGDFSLQMGNTALVTCRVGGGTCAATLAR